MSERDDYDPAVKYSEQPLRITKIRGVISYLSENVSRMFLVAGFLILLSLPFFRNDLSKGLLPLSIFGVIILVFLAGFTSKKYRWTVVLDAFISMCGLLIFSYQSVTVYTSYGTIFFGINLTLSIIFLLSFYFTIRIIRDWFNNLS